jgi:3-hydroxyacyl-[acyl-carrier-protein] dehydratase
VPKELSIREIMELIPHRYPFLLLDRITEVTAGKRAVGYKNVTINEPFFAGHFPGQPVMPGVLIVEAMAQLGAAAVLSMEEFRGKLLLFRGFNNVHFRGVVSPGDKLDLEVTLTAIRGRVGRGKGVASVDGKTVASGEITFAIAERG